jgi:hypothetical protein
VVRAGVKSRLRAGDHEAIVDTRGPISDVVWNRRAADKVAPIVRWALHHVRTDPVQRDPSAAERLDHFRQRTV